MLDRLCADNMLHPASVLLRDLSRYAERILQEVADQLVPAKYLRRTRFPFRRQGDCAIKLMIQQTGVLERANSAVDAGF